AVGAGGAGGPAMAVRLVGAGGGDCPGLAVLEEVGGILGVEEYDAADGAGPVCVGDRAANDVNLLDEVGVDEEHGLRAVVRALEVLAGAVDDDRDTAEILQPANVDGGGGAAAVRL